MTISRIWDIVQPELHGTYGEVEDEANATSGLGRRSEDMEVVPLLQYFSTFGV